MTNKPKLIFVYNADSGLKNAILDSAHKILSPKTYQCRLCDLTYGAFKEKKVWKKYREQTDVEMKFLHADEFKQLYKSKFIPDFEFPIVLIENQYNLDVLISAVMLDEIEDCEGLIERINYLVKSS